jgi:hypothetical protein
MKSNIKKVRGNGGSGVHHTQKQTPINRGCNNLNINEIKGMNIDIIHYIHFASARAGFLQFTCKHTAVSCFGSQKYDPSLRFVTLSEPALTQTKTLTAVPGVMQILVVENTSIVLAEKNRHAQILEKPSNIKFHENLSSGTGRRTDRRMEGET